MDINDVIRAKLFGSGGNGGESSGGLKHASGTWTPASDTSRMNITLDFLPFGIIFYIEDSDKQLDGVPKVLSGMYLYGMGCGNRTNSAGTGEASVSTREPDNNISSGNDYLNPYIPRPMNGGGFAMYSNYFFKAGYTYTWEAWGE